MTSHNLNQADAAVTGNSTLAGGTVVDHGPLHGDLATPTSSRWPTTTATPTVAVVAVVGRLLAPAGPSGSMWLREE